MLEFQPSQEHPNPIETDFGGAVSDPIDVDSLLDDLDYCDTETDDSRWGGANLEAPRSVDRPHRPYRGL